MIIEHHRFSERKSRAHLFDRIRTLSKKGKTRIDLFRVFQLAELNKSKFRFSKKNDFHTLTQANYDFEYAHVYEVYKKKDKKVRFLNQTLFDGSISKNDS